MSQLFHCLVWQNRSRNRHWSMATMLAPILGYIEIVINEASCLSVFTSSILFKASFNTEASMRHFEISIIAERPHGQVDRLFGLCLAFFVHAFYALPSRAMAPSQPSSRNTSQPTGQLNPLDQCRGQVGWPGDQKLFYQTD